VNATRLPANRRLSFGGDSSSAFGCYRCANAFRRAAAWSLAAFATIIGVVTAFLYVGLFTQAFSIVVATVDLAGSWRSARQLR